MEDLEKVVVLLVIIGGGVISGLQKLAALRRAGKGLLGANNDLEKTVETERRVQQELERRIRMSAPSAAKPAPPPMPNTPPHNKPVPVKAAPETLAQKLASPPPAAPKTIDTAGPEKAPTVVPAPAVVEAKKPLSRSPSAAYRPAPVRARQLGARRHIGARAMARAAILSEIFRPPVALRDTQPWDRS
jgi:hypothetical protein